ncbi:MAG: RagB/SusD family nutrient uptake outer membrane protein [Odoribacteraceae bacterium]|jgi:hypothetical protein|nr:RagB/SusD family nutrient uptake outer membrane protein [Odoribacteraceae bacterium]
MKKIRLHARLFTGSLLLSILLFSRCEKIMQVDLNTSMNAGDHYSSTNEVYGAFIGLSASFVKVTEQGIFLAGLKGDLMRPTDYAPEAFWRIFRYEANNEDTYTGSGLYYDIVINCNDFLRRVIKYNQDLPGNIPESEYRGMISSAIKYKVWSLLTIAQFWGEASVYNTNLEEINEQAMVQLDLNDLPAYLIGYMFDGEDGVNAFQALDWKNILSDPNVDWSGSDLNADILLGELRLWSGDYLAAINNYISGLVSVSATLTTGYFSIFTNAPNLLKSEVFTVAPFNATYHQTNYLNKYFAYSYYLAPTSYAIELFDKQTYSNYSPGDAVRKNATYIQASLNHEEVWAIIKYLNNTNVPIYRAGQIYLNIAEAYAYLGRFEESLAFLDGGLKNYWTGATFREPFEGFSSTLQSSNGVRGRANLLPLDPEEIFASSSTRQDSIRALCGLIADETTLELAYEGKRWPTLVRVARNLKDPSFLADRVVVKFDEAERGHYRQLLTDPANWYIKDEKRNILK